LGLCSNERLVEQNRDCHRSDATWHRREKARGTHGLVEGDIADVPSL
jgi:hypothetical protein